MANDVTKNPWILDTAGAITTDRIRVKTIRWVDATTADHDCIIHDGAGREVWVGVATGADYSEAQLVEEDWEGVDLDTIDSGIVYLHYQ